MKGVTTLTKPDLIGGEVQIKSNKSDQILLSKQILLSIIYFGFLFLFVSFSLCLFLFFTLGRDILIMNKEGGIEIKIILYLCIVFVNVK